MVYVCAKYDPNPPRGSGDESLGGWMDNQKTSAQHSSGSEAQKKKEKDGENTSRRSSPWPQISGTKSVMGLRPTWRNELHGNATSGHWSSDGNPITLATQILEDICQPLLYECMVDKLIQTYKYLQAVFIHVYNVISIFVFIALLRPPKKIVMLPSPDQN